MPEDSLTWLGAAWLIAWLAPALIASSHAILHKRSPESATLWVVVCMSLPLVGAWLYLAFGINRIERRAMQRVAGKETPDIKPVVPESSRDHTRTLEHIGHLQPLRRIADKVTRMPLLAGNRLKPLHHGEVAYPAMLDAIAHAKKSVTLTSYIFDWDAVGRSFTEALREAASRGVRVHVLVDGIGAVHSFSRMGRHLMSAGAEVSAFFPLRFPLGRVRVNLRNHRKILVVDGRVGFTGGMNISQRYLITRKRRHESEDLHFQLEGPIVGELQQSFAEDWYLATDHILTGDDYFPMLEHVGEAVCRGIDSGPDQDFESIHWVMQGALATAQHTVRIVTPYFVPTSDLLSSMSLAAMRGVDVKIVLPSFVDLPYMRWAADAYLSQVLERGAKVYHRRPPFVHTKLMIVDDRWILLGSANMDRRSFRLNFEFNVEAYDPKLASLLADWFDKLIPQSKQVTRAFVESRSRLLRLRDGVAKLFSPYL